MDMRSYGPKRITPDRVCDGPITARIIAVHENQRFGRPELELDNGSQFLLNQTNNTVLMKAWGWRSEDFIGQEIEFSLGTCKSWNDDQEIVEIETVKVRAISPAKTAQAQNGSEPAKPPLPPPLKNDLDDEIPF